MAVKKNSKGKKKIPKKQLVTIGPPANQAQKKQPKDEAKKKSEDDEQPQAKKTKVEVEQQQPQVAYLQAAVQVIEQAASTVVPHPPSASTSDVKQTAIEAAVSAVSAVATQEIMKDALRAAVKVAGREYVKEHRETFIKSVADAVVQAVNQVAIHSGSGITEEDALKVAKEGMQNIRIE